MAREQRRASSFEYRDAKTLSPFFLERLAKAEGASNLLEAFLDDGATSEAALLALPYADDADVAMGTLADFLTRGGPRCRQVLDVMVDIARSPPEQREPLDPEGIQHSGEVLLTVARNPAVPDPERARAIAALRALARKGGVDGNRIPDRIR